MPLLEVQHLQKVYTSRFGGRQVEALQNVNFSVEPGEYVAIMGESGSGKTTLLNILAALDRPTAGEVFLNGKALSDVRERDLAAFRRSHLGFVFQDFNLLDIFSLRDNIFLPLVLAGRPYEEMERKLKPLADRSSGRQWPGPSSRTRRSFWRTSPPAPWTPGPLTICWSCSARSTRAARPS